MSRTAASLGSLGLLLCSVLWAFPVAAQLSVLPPGLEDEIAALVFPGDDDPDLGAGVRVGDVRIESSHIDVELVATDGGTARVRLVERGADGDGVSIGDTASFSLWLIDPGDAALRAGADALRGRIAQRDEGGFFPARSVAATHPPNSLLGGAAGALVTSMRVVRAVLWIALLAALVVLGARLRGGIERRDALIALGLVGAALALRLVLPPWAPLHANDHGISEMRGFVGAPGPHEAALYGRAYLDLVRTVLAPFGRWDSGPLLLAALAGSLAPLALFALARGLVPAQRFGAALAGLALVVHPIHIRLSLSECPRTLAGTLWLTGLALAVWALGATRAPRDRDIAWVTAAIAWSLAAELRVLTLLLPWAGLLFAVVAAARRGARPSIAAIAAALLLTVVVSAAHVSELEGVFAAASRRPLEPAALAGLALQPDHQALLDPTLTPPLLFVLLGLGAVGLWTRGERRLIVTIVGTFAVLLPASLLVHACRTDVIRYQSEAHFPLFLLLLGIATPARTSVSSGLPILAPAVLILGAIPGWLDAHRPDVHAQAYAIARSSAPPAPVPILIPPVEMPLEPRVRSEFPDYAIPLPSRVASEPREGCRVWIGVSCWSFSSDEMRGGATGIEVERGAPLRTECVELLGGIERARQALDELAPVDVPHRDREFHSILASRPRVGFAPCPE